MSTSDVAGWLLLIAFTVVRGAFIVGVVVVVVAIVRGLLRPAAHGGSATPGTAFAAGRPEHKD